MSIKAVPITDSRSQYEIERHFTKFYLNYVPKTPLGADFKPNYCVLPAKYSEVHEKIRNFKVRNDDVFLCGNAKSGTTWAQEMVWLINNDLDYEKAKSKNLLYERFRLLEGDALKANEATILGVTESDIEALNNSPSPRHIKCHLPLAFLPENIWEVNPKIVYVVRNPKDAAISYFHHLKNVRGFKGTLEDFLGLYLSGQIIMGPYFDHLLGFWKLRDLPNILIITYEDMKRDLREVINKVAVFLDKKLNEDDVDGLFEHLQIDSMRKNASCNFEERMRKSAVNKDFNFIRRGVAGAYKDEMPEEWIKKFDEAINAEMGDCPLYQ